MFEVGNKKSRFIFYRSKFFKNNKKLSLKKNEKIDKRIVFFKTPKRKSNISNFFAILIGFIFGFFENTLKPEKTKNSIEQNNKTKSENINNNKIKENKSIVLSKESKITKDILLEITLKDKENINGEVLNIENKRNNININKISVKGKDLSTDNKINNKKIIIPTGVIITYNGIKKLKPNADNCKKDKSNNSEIGDINKNLCDSNNLNNKNVSNSKQYIIEDIDTNFNQEELQNNIIEKEQEKSTNKKININSQEIDKGMEIISKELERQEKYLKKIDEILRKYNGKIGDKLKMNYFSNFFTNVLKVVCSLLPLRLFRNKLFGGLVSSILLNNSIKIMRNNMTLKNNATLIVPEYLKQMKIETDIITSLKLVCEDSLEQFYLLKNEFVFYNNKYSSTDEFKNFLKKLDIMEERLVKDLEYSKRLLLERENIEKNTKYKVYKIIRK